MVGILPLIIGTGCSTTPLTVADLANQGKIQGKVYDLAASNLYAGKYQPIPGAKVYAGTAETVTGADGSYGFSGIPAGVALITASAEGYVPQTLAVNRNSVNIYLGGGTATSESGAATVTGTVYGLPTGVTSVYGGAFSLLKSSASFNYDPSLYKYALTGAPDDGETYLFAYYASSEAGTNRYIYAYTKLNMTPASQEVNLDFGASTKSLLVKAALPLNYKYPTLGVNIHNGWRPSKNIYSGTQTEESTFSVSLLPTLQSGDSFGVTVTALNTITGEAAYKFLAKYNLAEGATVDLDLGTVPTLTPNSPNDEAALSANPAFSWEAINDDRVIYIVLVMSESPSRTVWTGYTKGNSLALPDTVTLSNGVYRWQVAAAYYSNVDLADLGLTSAQSYLNWGVVSANRRFTYVK